jgi:hypothetical protein
VPEVPKLTEEQILERRRLAQERALARQRVERQQEEKQQKEKASVKEMIHKVRDIDPRNMITSEMICLLT